MDYRRRKKIQLKTPEVIPGGVTVRKGKKGKRKGEKRGRGKHSLTRSPKKPLGSTVGQEGGERKGKKNKRREWEHERKHGATEMRYGKRNSRMDGTGESHGQRKSLNCSSIDR